MSNVTYSYVVLSLYGDLGAAKYLAFAATVAMYACVLASNASLVGFICLDRELRARPMFVLAASLFANQLLGSTAFLPAAAAQTLSSSHAVSPAACYLQIFGLYSYARVEFCTLAAMAYDRYLAVCRPLRYGAIATPRRALLVTLALWSLSMAWVAAALAPSAARPLCGTEVAGFYCQYYQVMQLLCGGVSPANYAYGLAATALGVVAPLLPVLYSYAGILRVVFTGRGQARSKAVATCAPHVVSLLSFCFGCTFQVAQVRFEAAGLPPGLRGFLALYYVLAQPVVVPLVYGGQMAQIRQRYKRLLCCPRHLPVKDHG